MEIAHSCQLRATMRAPKGIKAPTGKKSLLQAGSERIIRCDKLLVTPIVVHYIIPYITPFKGFRR